MPGEGCADQSLGQSLTNPHDPKCGPGKSSRCEPRVGQKCRLSGHPTRLQEHPTLQKCCSKHHEVRGHPRRSSQVHLPHHPAAQQCPPNTLPPKFTLLPPNIKLLSHSPGDSLFLWRDSAGPRHRPHGDVCLFKMRELDHKES